MRPPLSAVLTAAYLTVASSQTTQEPSITTKKGLPDSGNLPGVLAAMQIPDDNLQGIKRVSEWAMGAGNWSDKDRIQVWLEHPKIILLQPPVYFQQDLDKKKSFLDTLSKLASRPLKAEDWSRIPLAYSKMWYATVRSGGFSAIINDPVLTPLVAGAPDEDIVEWLREWSEQKHNRAIAALSSASSYMGPSQVQLLAAPLIPVGFAKPGSKMESVQKANLGKLDVSQLGGLVWKETLMVSNLNLPTVIAIATQSGFDPKVVNSDPSMLGLYSALRIEKAISKGDLRVTESVLRKAGKLDLTRGQATVLADGYISKGKDKLSTLPNNYLFAMPSKYVSGLKEDDRLRKTLELMISKYYSKLLPEHGQAL